MRILWLSPYVPLPGFGGGTRVYNLIKALSACHEIDLIASGEPPWNGEAGLTPLRALCRSVELVPPAVSSRQWKRLRQLRSLVSRYPAQYWNTYTPAMQQHIDRAVRARTYDLVVVEHAFLGYYRLPDELPRVLDQHNVESAILRRSARSERTLARRLYNGLEWLRFRPDERRFCREASLILATSTRDRDEIRRWPGTAPCIVIPNGVDSAFFTPDGDVVDGNVDAIFTGSMHYGPNAEAALYLADILWPRLRLLVPEATLEIVGGNPSHETLRLNARPGVTVRAHVFDIRAYIAAATVVVAPLRIGGGTRLKILEALSMGKAVVSTSLGCEGLEVEDGRHLLVADNPVDFAARVADLLRDPARRAWLGSEGRRLVQEKYDWRIIGATLEMALRDLIKGEGAVDAPARVDNTLSARSAQPSVLARGGK